MLTRFKTKKETTFLGGSRGEVIFTYSVQEENVLNNPIYCQFPISTVIYYTRKFLFFIKVQLVVCWSYRHIYRKKSPAEKCLLALYISFHIFGKDVYIVVKFFCFVAFVLFFIKFHQKWSFFLMFTFFLLSI
jgi:hypothetical protein